MLARWMLGLTHAPSLTLKFILMLQQKSLYLVSIQPANGLQTLILFFCTGIESAFLAAISDDATASEGDAVVLTCLAWGFPDVAITWMLNGQTIENSSFITIFEDYSVQGRGVLRQTTLQVCAITIEDTGEYTCIANSGLVSTDASTQLTLIGKFIKRISLPLFYSFPPPNT